MPTVLTHIGFVEKIAKKKKAFFKNLDMRYLLSGSLFPDYYGFYRIQTKFKPELFMRSGIKRGITFGKRMYALAKTKRGKILCHWLY